jgi:hypothetical protein
MLHLHPLLEKLELRSVPLDPAGRCRGAGVDLGQCSLNAMQAIPEPLQHFWSCTRLESAGRWGGFMTDIPPWPEGRVGVRGRQRQLE